MDNTELAFQIEMLTQIIGRLCENAHLDGMLENLTLQYGFTHEQYIGISVSYTHLTLPTNSLV